MDASFDTFKQNCVARAAHTARGFEGMSSAERDAAIDTLVSDAEIAIAVFKEGDDASLYFLKGEAKFFDPGPDDHLVVVPCTDEAHAISIMRRLEDVTLQ
jgi:hypothetical protein